MGEIGIIVGRGSSVNQNEISRTLSKKGYFVKKVAEDWPRDVYVFHNNKIISNDWNVPYNFLGDGGNIQVSDDFVLISDTALIDQNLNEEFKGKGDLKNLILQKAEKEFESKVYLSPTDFESKNSASPHIDLYTLLLPNSKILMFDNKFGKDANKNFEYNKIAEENEFKFFEYDSGKDDVWYGLNSLVLKKGEKDIVVLESQSKNLIKLLNQNNVETIPIEMLQSLYPAGRIHCQTNTFKREDQKKIDYFF